MNNNHDVKGEVGYKKPPCDRQFKKGQSGNPKGRPKGSKNLSSILLKELNVRIPITENGKQRFVTKQEAIVKGTINNALRGDHKFTSVIWSDLRSREDQIGDGSSAVPYAPVSQEDGLVMESIVRRILASHGAPSDSPAPTSSELKADPSESEEEPE